MGVISFKRDNFEDDAPVGILPIERPVPRYSEQQLQAIQWVPNGRGNLLMTAVAGAGKTTAIIGMVEQAQGYVTVCCYNKGIQLEVADKLGIYGYGTRVQVGTVHSFGMRAWRRVAPSVKIEGFGEKNAGYYKFDRIMDIMDGAETFRDFVPSPMPYEYRSFVRKLMGLAKQYAIGASPMYPADNFSSWLELVHHFDLDEVFAEEYDQSTPIEQKIEQGIKYAQQALVISIALSRDVIDFDDMVYMPLFTECRMFQVNWIFVDEAQDINRSRRLLIRKMLSPFNGRAVFVGDPAQAIYGFSGADADAFAQIKKEFKCQELPLTVSFRCPKRVVELARTWVSHITSAPEAKDGICGKMNLIQFAQMPLKDTDAILCRNNAPLVTMAFALIRKGVACYVEGRDIGKGLIELAERWRVVRISALVEKAKAYRVREINKLVAKGHDSQAAFVADQVDTLLAIVEGMPKEATLVDLQARIKSMFQDANEQRRRVLVLSSVHKSKGREWPRVFLLGRNCFMPSKYARQDWHKEQERNLMYVAVTRAMDEFYDIILPTREKFTLQEPAPPLEQFNKERVTEVVE